MSHPFANRRRGGQPGNTNRLRHGLYSRHLASSSGSVDPGFQLALARKRLLQLLERQSSASPRDWLSYERGILHYLQLIIRLKDDPAACTLSYLEEAFPSASLLDLDEFGSPSTADQYPPQDPIRTSAGIARIPRVPSAKRRIRTSELNRANGLIFNHERSLNEPDE